MKRKAPLRKDIPDWRDPDMPVIDDGKVKTPEQFQKERQRSLINSEIGIGKRLMPEWRDDPTYGKKS